MSRRYYFSDWDYQKNYLIRNLFHYESRPSTIPEESIEETSPVEATQARPPAVEADAASSSSSLPSLTIEVTPKVNKHDDPPEFYVNLERRILKYYRRLIIDNKSDATLSTDSDMSLTNPVDRSHFNSDETDEFIDVETCTAKGHGSSENDLKIIDDKDVGDRTYVIGNEDADSSNSTSAEENTSIAVTFSADVHAEPKKPLNIRNHSEERSIILESSRHSNKSLSFQENMIINQEVETEVNNEKSLNLEEDQGIVNISRDNSEQRSVILEDETGTNNDETQHFIEEQENVDVSRDNSEEKSVILVSSYPRNKSLSSQENIVINQEDETGTNNDNTHFNEEKEHVDVSRDNSEEKSVILESSYPRNKSLSLQDNNINNQEDETGTNNDETQHFIEEQENVDVSRDNSEEKSVILESSYPRNKSLSLQDNNIINQEDETGTNNDNTHFNEEKEHVDVSRDNSEEKSVILQCSYPRNKSLSLQDNNINNQEDETGTNNDNTHFNEEKEHVDVSRDNSEEKSVILQCSYPRNKSLSLQDINITNQETGTNNEKSLELDEEQRSVDVPGDDLVKRTTGSEHSNNSEQFPEDIEIMRYQRKYTSVTSQIGAVYEASLSPRSFKIGCTEFASSNSSLNNTPRRYTDFDFDALLATPDFPENLAPETSKLGVENVTKNLENDIPMLDAENPTQQCLENLESDTRVVVEIDTTSNHSQNVDSETPKISEESKAMLERPENLESEIAKLDVEISTTLQRLENVNSVIARMGIVERDDTPHHPENVDVQTPKLVAKSKATPQSPENVEPEIPVLSDDTPQSPKGTNTPIRNVENDTAPQCPKNLESDISTPGVEKKSTPHHLEHLDPGSSMRSVENDATPQTSDNSESDKSMESDVTSLHSEHLEPDIVMREVENDATSQRAENLVPHSPIQGMESVTTHPSETFEMETLRISDFVTTRKRLKQTSLAISSMPSKKSKFVDVGVQKNFDDVSTPRNFADANVHTDFDDIRSTQRNFADTGVQTDNNMRYSRFGNKVKIYIF